MSAWFKRFGLHLAAAVGATGVFVAAAAVGASQTREQAVIAPATATVRPRPAGSQPKPRVVVTPTPATPTSGVAPAGRPPQQKVNPERSLAGTVRNVLPTGLDVVGVGGREWLVEPVPGALIRRNGKAAKLDALQPGDGVVILGQAQPGPGAHFTAHAITAKSK